MICLPSGGAGGGGVLASLAFTHRSLSHINPVQLTILASPRVSQREHHVALRDWRPAGPGTVEHLQNM